MGMESKSVAGEMNLRRFWEEGKGGFGKRAWKELGEKGKRKNTLKGDSRGTKEVPVGGKGHWAVRSRTRWFFFHGLGDGDMA